MSKNIFIVLLLLVGFTFTTGTIFEIDKIDSNNESQITFLDTTRHDTLTANRALSLDANKDLVSSAVTDTELGYLSGVTSAIQTQLDNTVLLTGDQSAAGEKTFTGKIIASSTSDAFQPCPSMTQVQRDALSPSAGECVYNTTANRQEVYNGASWVAGGGGGTGTLNLLEDPGFEAGVSEGSATTCAASVESTVILDTPFNSQSLELACSSSTGNYTVTKTTGSEFSGVQALASAWIKTSAAGVEFCSIVDGSESLCVEVANGDTWVKYPIFDIAGGTSFGWRVKATSSITDSIFIDETFAGPANVGDKRLSKNCDGFGCENTFAARIANPSGTASITTQAPASWLASASATSQQVTLTFASSIFTVAPSCIVQLDDSAISNDTVFVSSVSTSTVVVDTRVSASTPGNNDSFSVLCTKQGADFVERTAATFITSQCIGADCENNFSAKISAAGVVSDESVNWLDGNCSQSSGDFDCSLVGSLFANAPNCTISINGASDGNATITNVSTSELDWSVVDITNSDQAYPAMVVCQRSGDFVAQKEVSANISNHVKSPGVSRPVIASAFVTDGSSTTTVTREYGNFINGVCSNGATGQYTCTFESSYWASVPNCTVTPLEATIGGIAMVNVSAVSTSAISIITASDTGGAIDQDFILVCHGDKSI